MDPKKESRTWMVTKRVLQQNMNPKIWNAYGIFHATTRIVHIPITYIKSNATYPWKDMYARPDLNKCGRNASVVTRNVTAVMRPVSVLMKFA